VHLKGTDLGWTLITSRLLKGEERFQEWEKGKKHVGNGGGKFLGIKLSEEMKVWRRAICAIVETEKRKIPGPTNTPREGGNKRYSMARKW